MKIVKKNKKQDIKIKKILVVDDHPAILDAMKYVLDDAGYATEVSHTGESVAELSGELPDLIILDVLLSGRDGRDIVKALKSKESTCKIPVLMISARISAAESVKKAGADDFLAKPFSIEDLLKKIQMYLPETQQEGVV